MSTYPISQNLHVEFCPNKQCSFEPFMCWYLVPGFGSFSVGAGMSGTVECWHEMTSYRHT